MTIIEMENQKIPRGHVTLVGLGRLGFRIALDLIQVHRGGPKKITVIDGQKISAEDIIFRMNGGTIGEYKVDLLHQLSHPQNTRQIETIHENIAPHNLDLITGDVVSIQIAGGDTLPVTAMIVAHAHSYGAKTISTMGVSGIGNEQIRALDIDSADPHNPIVKSLRDQQIKGHILVGTGKLIRDWEPVTPHILDRVSEVMTAEILTLLHETWLSG
ncbi:UBA/THIF-type NAD/FAD binding fold protein [Methanospirillum hungatei JF-1]|uniref:UBA/THIF-type NAD/FAD binding fold protein n=1 Tax=Methanospirillum hungatei JF-1 (strain ATCC 27890 / DSM 864 / NBRC 100397 / JF-1) TaxID=323259 RepID=Q2FPY0_METHJ|nr:ThiF family adenylyltransferase [Methanospirillum hungatei]ABD40001.1 UBA/THIF-type NAD/FAD binding fold protein [Methanospirillum hungatei JF-1]